MFVIVPQCDIPSPEKTERLLEFISDVAVFTHQKEPQCRAYAWFRSAGDNDAVPHHWIRGMEVYETPEANRETHRAGEAYQAFRAGVVAENLLAGYPDVRFWRPTGVGFLTSASVNLMGGESPSHGYIVVQDLSPLPDGKAQVLEALEPVAQAADKSTKVGSFWVLERENQEDGHELTVFSAFGSKSDYDEFVASEEAGGWKSIGDVCQTAITTTWKNSQIGFLGR